MARKKTVKVLTETLAQDFNSQVGKYLGDDIRLRELMLDLDHLKKKRLRREIVYRDESTMLAGYLSGLSHEKHALIVKTIKTTKRGLMVASRESEIDKATIGYLRGLSIDELKRISGVGHTAAVFLKVAFKQND